MHRTESSGYRPISYTAADTALREDARIRRPHGSAKDLRRPQRMPTRAETMTVGKMRRRYGSPEQALAVTLARLNPVTGSTAATRCQCPTPFPFCEDRRWTCAQCELPLPRSAWPVLP